MPEVNGVWQDWTAEAYAQTEEWQEWIDKNIAFIKEKETRPMHLKTSLEELERQRREGPTVGQLEIINKDRKFQQEADSAFDSLGDTPEMDPMSIAEMRRYGLGEIDMQSRAVANQAGAASQRLGGLNPAARTQALSEISRGGAGMIGQGAGQAAQMANQSNLASFQGTMQDRGMMANSIQASLNQGYAMQQIGAQHKNAMDMARMQMRNQRNQSRGGGFWGAMGTIGGAVLGGPMGAMIGGSIGNAWGGRGGGNYGVGSSSWQPGSSGYQGYTSHYGM